MIVKANNEKNESIKNEYIKLECSVLNALGFPCWLDIPYLDGQVVVNSRQSLENYDAFKYLKENDILINNIENNLKNKSQVFLTTNSFLLDNEYKTHPQYSKIEQIIQGIMLNSSTYRVQVEYISYAGNHLGEKIGYPQYEVENFINY